MKKSLIEGNRIYFFVSVNIGQQLLMALLDNWPKTHIYEQQGELPSITLKH